MCTTVLSMSSGVSGVARRRSSETTRFLSSPQRSTFSPDDAAVVPRSPPFAGTGVGVARTGAAVTTLGRGVAASVRTTVSASSGAAVVGDGASRRTTAAAAAPVAGADVSSAPAAVRGRIVIGSTST